MPDDVIAPSRAAERSFEPRKGPHGVGAVEVRVRAERRRTWTPEDRLRIVRETLEPGVVAKVIAERHGISTGLLYTWRKDLLATTMAGFAAVQVVPEVPAPETEAGMAVQPLSEMSPTAEVVFPSGARLVLRGKIAPGLLREVMDGLAPR
ncbi:IS66-like element accessory protein TnpA [Roseomonas gilardii]|uniref:IS66-like element accessory protein TnpA n=1 Tax=Roseomonas gilardii TaxID=257708 RepID=UPI0011A63295|nr:transposase [Roseomonas gilardii]